MIAKYQRCARGDSHGPWYRNTNKEILLRPLFIIYSRVLKGNSGAVVKEEVTSILLKYWVNITMLQNLNVWRWDSACRVEPPSLMQNITSFPADVLVQLLEKKYPHYF